jgi:hypothetical protein
MGSTLPWRPHQSGRRERFGDHRHHVDPAIGSVTEFRVGVRDTFVGHELDIVGDRWLRHEQSSPPRLLDARRKRRGRQLRRLCTEARFSHDPLMKGGGLDEAVAGQVNDALGDDLPAALVACEYP